MKKVYEIATGIEVVMFHDIDAIDAVKSGYYAYELPEMPEKVEAAIPEVIFEVRKPKKKHEPSLSDSPLPD